MKKSLQRYIHFNMSLIGGFFGGFAIVSFGSVFGNAQTVNMISVVLEIIGHNFISVLQRIIAVLLYFGGFALSVVLTRYTHINTKYLSLAFHFAAVILIALLPDNLPMMFYVYPVFFTVPFQWSVFSGADGFASSTIFSSNNFRQFSVALTEYFCTKNNDFLIKAKFYGKTLLSYHFGVLLSASAAVFLGRNGIFVLFLPLLTAAVLITLQSEKPLCIKRKLNMR